MVSIVIAAHNEEAILDRTLDALNISPGEAEIVVVANGCSDGTAAVARSHPGVVVVELDKGSKPLALNAGDDVATSFPRIYLDADIVIPPGSIAALCAALDQPGILVAVPLRELDATGRPWVVREWAAVSGRLPAFRDGLFGRGFIAMSAAGRARFGRFPEMVADDLFLDSLFSAQERAFVAGVTVRVETEATTRDLVRRLVRVRRGSAAMRAAGARGDLLGPIRPADNWSWLRDVVLPSPHLIPAGVVYASITVLATLRARGEPGDSMSWGRAPDSLRAA